MLMQQIKPYLITYTGNERSEAYFHYENTIYRIKRLLTELYGAEMRLYMQEDGNDVWNWVEDEIRNGSNEATKLTAIYDLVEDRGFTFDEGADQGFRIHSTLRNNIIGYPNYRVAFARIPLIQQYGLGCEDIIFAENDETICRFLADLQERQLRDRKVTVFTDTNEGLEREREKIVRAVSREDVMLSDSLKTQIYRSIDEFFSGDREFFRTYDIPYKRGILLYGKPGNGKTTMVKSIAGSVDAPVAYWQITEYTNSESIQEVFSAALKMAPMILVIEDIDSMPESARSFFLNTLDGATSKEGIFLIGTTNFPEKIDPALMNRAGRFDRAYEVKLPDEAMRFEYLKRKGLAKLADVELVAQAARSTEGFSIAQLNELFVSAALQKHYEHIVDLERLIAELKHDLNKDRKGSWMSETGNRQMGFFAGA